MTVPGYELSQLPWRAKTRVRHAARTSTTLDPSTLVSNDSFRFLLQLDLRGAHNFYRTKIYHPQTRRPTTACSSKHATAHTPRSSPIPNSGAQRPVIQAGPRWLWDSVEATYQLWCHLGWPDPSRFGVVANSTTQFVWFDTDEGWYRWSSHSSDPETNC